jgi:hypothetical protein
MVIFKPATDCDRLCVSLLSVPGPLQGLHSASVKFAYESRSQRGWAKQEALNAAEKNMPKPVEDSVRSIMA